MQMETTNNSVVVEPLGSKFKLRFDAVVEQPSYYRFELEALSQAQSGDQVCITVNSDGGSLATGIEVANAIFDCKAAIEGTLRSSCHSCGSIIFLACHTHDVGLASEMLLHSGSGGNYGTPSQSIERAKSYKRQVRSLFETVYKGFLNTVELDQMIDEDKEFIFSGDDIVPRLENMYTYRAQLTDTFYQEQDDAMYEENNIMVAETLASLDVSESDKETFNRIHKMIDDSLAEQDTPSNEVATPKEEVLSLELTEVPFLAEDGTKLGDISYYQDGDNLGDIELEIELSCNDYVVPTIVLVDSSFLDADYRTELLEIMNKVTGRKYSKLGTETLINNFIKEVHRQIKENS